MPWTAGWSLFRHRVSIVFKALVIQTDAIPLLTMDRLFSLIPKVLHRRGLQEHAESALVVHRVEQWLQTRVPELTSSIRVQKVQNGALFLSCSNSVVLQECKALQADLMAYLSIECAFARIS